MKKMLILALLTTLLFSFASCNIIDVNQEATDVIPSEQTPADSNHTNEIPLDSNPVNLEDPDLIANESSPQTDLNHSKPPSSSPPRTIIFDGMEDVNELTQMLSADDETLEEYLYYHPNQNWINGIKTREDIIACLEVINNAYFPVTTKHPLPRFWYYPERKHITLCYEIDGNNFLFSVYTEENTAEKSIDECDKDFINFIAQKDKITIYQHGDVEYPDPDREDIKWIESRFFLLDVQSYYVNARVAQFNADIPTEENWYDMFDFVRYKDIKTDENGLVVENSD